MKALAPLALACLLLAAGSQAEALLKTRYGTLRLVPSDPELGISDTLMLGKRQLWREEAYHLNLYQRFELGTQDVVLLGSNCGGTGCPNDDLSLVVLAPGQGPRIIGHKHFYSNDGTVNPQANGKQLVIDLGFENRKRKLAIYDGSTLKIELAAVTARPLNAADCKWTYEYAAAGCVEAAQSDVSCRSPQDTFPGVTYRGVAAIAHQPGFKTGNFDKLCVNMCKTRQLVNYNTFRKAVCGQP
ncbi:MAG TPA: hypothetical protein VJ642_11315 [Chromobacteriaceae bacterium]|nr:hypothetical protein [Chromobacteriaceae bacterium]